MNVIIISLNFVICRLIRKHAAASDSEVNQAATEIEVIFFSVSCKYIWFIFVFCRKVPHSGGQDRNKGVGGC